MEEISSATHSCVLFSSRDCHLRCRINESWRLDEYGGIQAKSAVPAAEWSRVYFVIGGVSAYVQGFYKV